MGMQLTNKEWLQLLQAFLSLEDRVRLLEDVIINAYPTKYSRPSDTWQVRNSIEQLIGKPKFSLEDIVKGNI